MSNFHQIQPLDDQQIHFGCMCCSAAGRIAHPDRLLAVGFGDTTVSRDDYCLYSESQRCYDGGELWTVAEAEKQAAADPDHDWRIRFIGPMHGETYQRHMRGRWAGQWVCIESDEGFA